MYLKHRKAFGQRISIFEGHRTVSRCQNNNAGKLHAKTLLIYNINYE